MMQDLHTVSASSALRLRPGEWVEVRSREDILATLAPDATLDGLPFMPEMLRFCGQRFQVHKRADKTCDSVDKTGGLRLRHTVHLQGLRCDASVPTAESTVSCGLSTKGCRRGGAPLRFRWGGEHGTSRRPPYSVSSRESWCASNHIPRFSGRSTGTIGIGACGSIRSS